MSLAGVGATTTWLGCEHAECHGSAADSRRRLLGRWTAVAVAVSALMVAALPGACFAQPAAGAALHGRAGLRSTRLPLTFYATPVARASAFHAQGPGYGLTIGPGRLTLSLTGARRMLSMTAVDSLRSEPAGAHRLPGVMNLYNGHEPRSSRTGLHTFAGVRERELWPGINALFDGRAGRLEYDFQLAPGALERRIVLRFSGMDRIALDEHGNLTLTVRGRRVLERAPRAWQLRGGHRVPVRARWILRPHGLAALAVGRYATARPLMIDPQLQYSTYTGRAAVAGMALGSDGGAYVAGGTPGGYYVQHLNAAGSAAVYTSVFSGASAFAITVDGSGNAYVTGTANSAYTTTAGAYESTSQIPSCSPASQEIAPFLTELSPTGAMLASTLLGGHDSCDGGWGDAVALDASGNAYVALTTSAVGGDLPITAGTYNQSVAQRGPSLGLAKVNLHNQGSAQLVWGTYVGPGGNAWITGVAVDSAGEPVVVGYNSFNITTGGGGGKGASPSRPSVTPHGFSQIPRDGESGWVEKLNATATKQLWSSQVLTAFDDLNAVTLDSSGNVFVVGSVPSQQQALCPQPNQAQTYCVLVAKLTSGGTTAWWKVLTGTNDLGNAIAVDSSGDVYVAGQTGSTTFPTTAGAMQTQKAGGEDAFLTELDPTGTTLKYSTYLGGTGDDIATAVALAPDGTAVLAGLAGAGFPTTAKAYNTTAAGGGFVSKIVPVNAPAASTGAALSITPTSATLNGSVDPHGPTANYVFQYGTSTRYGSSTASTVVTSAGAVQAEVGPLLPGTTYHFRLVATTAGGEANGADGSFTTAPPAPAKPTVTSRTPLGLTATAATLSGAVNPGNAMTTYWFEYGPTNAYGTNTTAQQLAPGGTSVPVSASLKDLRPSTEYHFALTATNQLGSSTTADGTFRTASARPPKPAAPRISRLALRPSRFSHRHPGTTISWRDSEAATTTVTVEHLLPGYAKGHARCRALAAGRPRPAHTQACTATGVLARLGHHDGAGSNRLKWSGKVHRQALTAGHYQITLVAKSGSRSSRSVTAKFSVS